MNDMPFPHFAALFPIPKAGIMSRRRLYEKSITLTPIPKIPVAKIAAWLQR